MILTGDALTMLRYLDSGSVQTCVTSPPYWGLRSYGTKPLVWDGDPTHRHVWGALIRTPWANDVSGPNGAVKNGPHSRNKPKHTGPFCECGAWRGDLGLEPTPELYTAHIVQIFREVRRVLCDDGTLWMNLGDSYATGGGKVGEWPGGKGQGEKWRGYKGDHGPEPMSTAIGPRTQPNRMPIAGLKPKDMVGIPWRVAFALQADGWYLRSDIIWHKTNPMPESIRDRPTKSHEYLFLLSKSERYYYDADAIKEPTTGSAHDRARKDRAADGQKALPTAERNGMRPGVNPKATKWPNAWSAEAGRHDGVGNGRFRASGNKARKLGDGTEGRLDTHLGRGVPWPPEIRPKQNESFSAAVIRTVEMRNKRTVWTLPTKPYKEAHFATFPPKLIEPCILAGSRPGDVVLDPFAGSGTTGMVAQQHCRAFIGVELKPAYVSLAEGRLRACAASR